MEVAERTNPAYAKSSIPQFEWQWRHLLSNYCFSRTQLTLTKVDNRMISFKKKKGERRVELNLGLLTGFPCVLTDSLKCFAVGGCGRERPMFCICPNYSFSWIEAPLGKLPWGSWATQQLQKASRSGTPPQLSPGLLPSHRVGTEISVPLDW